MPAFHRNIHPIHNIQLVPAAAQITTLNEALLRRRPEDVVGVARTVMSDAGIFGQHAIDNIRRILTVAAVKDVDGHRELHTLGAVEALAVMKGWGELACIGTHALRSRGNEPEKRTIAANFTHVMRVIEGYFETADREGALSAARRIYFNACSDQDAGRPRDKLTYIAEALQGAHGTDFLGALVYGMQEFIVVNRLALAKQRVVDEKQSTRRRELTDVAELCVTQFLEPIIELGACWHSRIQQGSIDQQEFPTVARLVAFLSHDVQLFRLPDNGDLQRRLARVSSIATVDLATLAVSDEFAFSCFVQKVAADCNWPSHLLHASEVASKIAQCAVAWNSHAMQKGGQGELYRKFVEGVGGAKLSQELIAMLAAQIRSGGFDQAPHFLSMFANSTSPELCCAVYEKMVHAGTIAPIARVVTSDGTFSHRHRVAYAVTNAARQVALPIDRCGEALTILSQYLQNQPLTVELLPALRLFGELVAQLKEGGAAVEAQWLHAAERIRVATKTAHALPPNSTKES